MKTLDDEVTERTLDFIERQTKANKPFFCWMCPARASAGEWLWYAEILSQLP